MARYRWDVLNSEFHLPLPEIAKKAMQFIQEDQPPDAVIITYEDSPYVIIECPNKPEDHPMYGIRWEEIPYDEAKTIPIRQDVSRFASV